MVWPCKPTFTISKSSITYRQCTARTDAVHCRDGCSALRGRLQCTASEMNKTGIEIASSILDKRKGRKDAPVAPLEISTEP